jgi:lipopolysaccharide export system permease protein
MTRIDAVILRRLMSNIGIVLAIMYGISALLEALNIGRFNALSAVGGPGLALIAIAGAAARGMLDAFPILILIGAIIGLLNLQASRELTVIRASGISIWRAMRAPLLGVALLGVFVSAVVDSGVVTLMRGLSPASLQTRTGNTDPVWFEERGAAMHYFMQAAYVDPGGESLQNVVVFQLDDARLRIEADTALLRAGHWLLPKALVFRSNTVPQNVTNYELPTSSNRVDIRARLTSVNDLTLFELSAALAGHMSDSRERSATEARLYKLLGLPLTLIGSVVIAFAFTSGYRRTNKYGGSVLYGILLGFVVYAIAEMANRAAYAGAMQPAVAVLGPSLLAIVAGATVLLNREDGRT